MPAAVVVVIAVAIAAIAFDRFPSERLRGDLFAALGYAANWRFMSASTSYADLFTSTPSPVLHFWSLAIEEQFYVVFPLVIAGLFTVKRRWVVPVGLSGLWVASLVSGLVSDSHNVVYYGAHARAAEILTGSLLALWLPLGGLATDSASRLARLVSSPRLNAVVFGCVAVMFGALVVIVDTGDSWLYSGGLTAISVLSAALILGVQCPGPIRWLAERRLVVRIGGLSYGLYVFHWPIFLLVTRDSTSLSGWPLNVVRLAITGCLAWVSAVLIERPVRQRRVLKSARTSAIALAVAVAVSVTVVAFVPRTPAQVLAGLDAPEGFVTFDEQDTRASLKVMVIGSETMIISRVRSALDDDYTLEIADETDVRCPLGGTTGCEDPVSRVDGLLGEHRPDIVIAAFGSLDRATVSTRVGEVIPDDPAFFDATKAYVNDVVAAVPTTPMLIIDLGPVDAMTAFIEDAALRSTSVSALVDPDPSDIVREVRTIRSMATGQDDRERVMVIGDSTSYGISVAIDHLEGERIDVLWAGGQNCPLVAVSAVKWWEGVEFDLERCPTIDDEWLAALDSFRPSVIVVAVSVPEQAEQRYPGDPVWHEPGSEEYLRVHDEFIARFMAEVDLRDIDVLVLDSPMVHGGALGDAPFSDPERIAAWNAVISRWAEQWPRVVIVPWAQAMTAFEPTPGALRGDGVHLRQEDLDVLVDRALLPTLVQQLFGVDAGSAVETETEAVEGP